MGRLLRGWWREAKESALSFMSEVAVIVGAGGTWVRGGGHGGVQPQTSQIRNPTLEEAILCQGPILGYKRSKSNQYPNTSLIQIEGMVMRQEKGFLKAKVKKNEITAPHTGRKTGLRCQWNWSEVKRSCHALPRAGA
ncbi:hypothetical protein CK203_046979 [Vitis vinifera]|uniref:Uncharacterized protein n=1 Tax=Vitis vinifera TaxID=29760 RepID=A0A438FWM6_VITVI|nr:hypothetical protein CK203_046979 [Vitis vinifera]